MTIPIKEVPLWDADAVKTKISAKRNNPQGDFAEHIGKNTMNKDSKKVQPGAFLVNDQLQDGACQNGKPVNTHFALSVVAVCLSCFTGFFAIPLALAGLILSLRAQDQVAQGWTEEAAHTAYWAALFGWITVGVVVLPVLLFIFFGGTILAGLAAIISAL